MYGVCIIRLRTFKFIFMRKKQTMISTPPQYVSVFTGLFHQVILQSGSELAVWAINGPGQRPEHYTRDVSSNCVLSIFRVSFDYDTWWRHQMEIFSASLVLCAGNSPVTGEFPLQRPVTRSFDVFFDLRLNKRLSKQSWGWRFETP